MGAGSEGRDQGCLMGELPLIFLGPGSFFRFFCLLLGPSTLGKGYHEIGRAMAILLSDPVSWAGVCMCVCVYVYVRARAHTDLCQ